MDALSLGIIVIAVATAAIFKLFIVKRVRAWVERDLIRSLAAGDQQRIAALQQYDQQLIAAGISQAERCRALETRAAELKAVDSK